MIRVAVLLITVALLMVAPLTASAVMMIDNFSDSPSWSLEPLPNQTLTRLDTGLTDTIGGSRFTTATDVNGNPFNFQLDAVGGYLHFSLGAGPDASYGTTSLLYDRNGKGLGTDLSSAQSIDVHYWADQFGYLKPSIMSLTLTDDFNHAVTDTRAWSTYTLVQAWRNEYFPLSNFTGVDASHIKSILFYFEGDWGNDLSFDYIRANSPVPEPATLSLLGLGIAALSVAKKSKTQ